MDAHSFLVALTVVLGVAALTTVVFQRLHQPVVLGYILAGFIVGPNVPVPLVADREIVQTLSELGVILLMFSLGLEFSLGKLFKLGPTAGLTALLQSSLMVWLGFVTGRLFGWSTVESLFCGAIIAISSTTIIAKAFDEQKIRGPLRELVVGVLIVEDLIAILLMAVLTAVASGTGLSAADMAMTVGKLVLFLVALIAIGLLLVPRVVRAIVRLGRPETTLVASIGFCFGVSLLAHELGYSVALGAFIAGSLIAESGEGPTIEHLVTPVRDIFAAIFFVSVGVLIDPSLIARHWPVIVVLTLVVVVGKVVGVSIGAFLTGNSVRTSVKAGMSLAQIGEFSFIIAGLGLSLNATGDFLYPIAVAVSAITTLTTPWLIRASGPVATFVDRKMPRPIQTFLALYGSWVEQYRSGAQGTSTRGSALRRLIRLLALDVTLLAALAIGTSVALSPFTRFVGKRLGIGETIAKAALILLAVALAVPLVTGMVRVARQLGLAISEVALPAAPEGTLDLAATPRRALVVTLQLATLLLTGLPFLAVTQPFLGGVYGPALFAVLLLALGLAFWRGATELQGHVRAGSQAIIEALIAQARPSTLQPALTAHDAGSAAQAELFLRTSLPGMGQPTPVQLDASSPSIGKSLAELNLRGVTGATVLAITRGDAGVLVPTAKEVLRAGDTLALAGTHEAIDDAKQFLASGLVTERASP
jgi:CPA2 family monovalent cation:H+ antiporter-2